MILVTGGTGFVGKVLIRHLVARGKQVRTLLRPSPVSPKLPSGVPVDVAVSGLKDERGLKAAMKGVDVVYHLAGTERQGSHSDLQGVDVEGTQIVARIAAEAGVRRFFFLSHIGTDRFSAYPLLKAKAFAEQAILKSGLPYTIFRTALLFGPEDQFTTSLVRLLRLNPFFFLLPGDGSTLIQPLWIEDLVTCLTLSLEDESTANQIFTVGGIETLTFRHILELIMGEINIKRSLVSFSPAYVRLLSVWFEQSRRFPISAFTLDYLSANRTCSMDTLPRTFGLIPARFSMSLAYLAQNRAAG